MWRTNPQEDKQEIDNDNLLPLLKGLDPNAKLVISSIGNGAVNKSKDDTSRRRRLWILLLVGTVSLLVGCALLTCSPYEWIMEDFLEMRTFSPIFLLWKEPPHIITFSINIFQAVNHEEFLASDDPNVKLEMKDIGRVLYREHIKHVNVSHHDNGTMSYTTVRYLEFLEDQNEPGILNRTVIVPNFGLIGALSYLHELPFITKLAFNVILNSADEPIFINITVYDFLWNYHSNVVNLGNKFLPSTFPVKNIGIMHRIYDGYVDRVNVKIGKKNGYDKFFHMQEYNYQSNIPGFDPEKGDCNATVVDSTEAYLLSRRLDNETVLQYYRKSICQVIPLYFDGLNEVQGMEVFEYALRPSEVYKRKANLSEDCGKGSDPYHILPDGLADLSKCYYGFPMVLSAPHFFGFENQSYAQRVTGLQPDPVNHSSKMYVEPILGVAMKEMARSQFNTYVRDLSGFPTAFSKFSNMVLPVAWLEMLLEEVPIIPLLMMKIVVKVLPLIDYITPLIFITLGLISYLKSTNIYLRAKSPTASPMNLFFFSRIDRKAQSTTIL